MPLRPSMCRSHGALGSGAARRRSDPRRARAVGTPPARRQLRLELWRWALCEGRSIDVDAGVVLSELLACDHDAPTLVTEERLTEVVWVDAVQWCNERGVRLPSGFASAVHTFVDFLAATGRLHPHSDPVDELHDLVDAVGAPGSSRTDATSA